MGLKPRRMRLAFFGWALESFFILDSSCLEMETLSPPNSMKRWIRSGGIISPVSVASMSVVLLVFLCKYEGEDEGTGTFVTTNMVRHTISYDTLYNYSK